MTNRTPRPTPPRAMPPATIAAAALALCAAVLPGAAGAAVISFSHVTPRDAVPFTDVFTLPGFDPALGTLTGVTVSATTDALAEIEVFNNTGRARNFTNARATIPLTVTAPAGVTLNVTATAGPIAGTAAPGFNTYSGNAASGAGSIVLPAAAFASFIGTAPGTYSAEFGDGTFTGTATPGVFFSGAALAGGTTSITYTYDAAPVVVPPAPIPPTPVPPVSVPEPMSLALLGAGLLGTLALRRKRD